MIKGKLWIVKNECFKRVSFGIDGIFSIAIYLNGITFSLCYLNTNMKRYDISFGWKPVFYQKIDY